MKKFLLNIVLLAAIVTSLAFFLDYAITTGLHKRVDYQQEVWNDLMNPTINPTNIP